MQQSQSNSMLTDQEQQAQELIDDLNDILLTDHFKMLEILGQGSFGIVVAAYSSQMDKIIAIKITSQVNQENEANLLQECTHPNIVKLYKVLAANNRLYLIMEKLQGVTLDKLLQQKELSENEVRNIMTQILNALVFLHRKGIIHRDIKPENIFICKNNLVKLIDLGLGYQIVCRGKISQQVGTPYYAAPEIVNGWEYNQAVDIFSLGIIYYMMLNKNQHPLWNKKMRKRQYYELISSEFQIDYPESLSEMAKDFIKNTVTFSPHNRMIAQQCLEHPWIKGEERKSQPQTQREYILQFQGCQKITQLIKLLMVYSHICKISPRNIQRLSIMDHYKDKEESVDPPDYQQSARYQDVREVKPKSRLFNLKEKGKSLFRQNTYQEIQNQKNKILIQRRYQMMISRYKEKPVCEGSQHKKQFPVVGNSNPISKLTRQQSLNLNLI